MPKGSRFMRSERVALELPGRPCTNCVAITGRRCPLFWLLEGLLQGTRTRWCYRRRSHSEIQDQCDQNTSCGYGYQKGPPACDELVRVLWPNGHPQHLTKPRTAGPSTCHIAQKRVQTSKLKEGVFVLPNIFCIRCHSREPRYGTND